MKKLLTLLLTLLMVFTLVGCNSKEDALVVQEPEKQEEVEETKEEPEIVGGYIDVEDGTLTDELKDIFTKALEGLLGAKYEPVELVATQVVAGTNYKFLANGTKTTNPVTKGTYYIYVNKDLQGNVSLLDIETIEEKQEEAPKQDVTQMSFWVVFYDQYGNELQREALKYGTIPEYKSRLPEGFDKWVYKKSQKDVGTLKAITGNTYYQAVCHEVYHSSSEPTPGPMQELTVEQILRTISGGFPIKTDTSFPENAWKNGNDIKCFILPTDGNEVLEFADGKMANEEVGLSTVTTIDGTNYKTTGKKGGIITFIMKNGILISIEVSGETWISSIINGSFISTSRPDGFVDLGVTNSSGNPLYWAKCNLGATNPEDFGKYYMWGTTALMYSAVDIEKTDDAFEFVTSNPYGDNYKNTWSASEGFDWENIPFAKGIYNNPSGTKNVFIKYTTSDDYAKSGTADNILTLESADDAATAKNPSWRIPTKADFVNLVSNCVLVWTTDYNDTSKSGYIVYKAKNDTDKGKAKMNDTWKKWNGSSYANDSAALGSYSVSDDHIFLPVTGYGNTKKLLQFETFGAYWTSTLHSSYNNQAYGLMFQNNSINIANSDRRSAYTIRPVAE